MSNTIEQSLIGQAGQHRPLPPSDGDPGAGAATVVSEQDEGGDRITLTLQGAAENQSPPMQSINSPSEALAVLQSFQSNSADDPLAALQAHSNRGNHLGALFQSTSS